MKIPRVGHLRVLPAFIVVVGLALTVSASGILNSSARQEPSSSRRQTSSSVKKKAPPAFTIEGDVKGLYPGLRKPLRLRIRNPNQFAIELRRVRVSVQDSDHPGCAARWIQHEKRLSVRRNIPAKGRLELDYPVRLRPAGPTDCQGASWPLDFSGTAVRAS